MKIERRGGVVYLRDSERNTDVIGLTPFEAEWLSQELRLHLHSEFIIQLHLAASDANKNSLELDPTTTNYPLKRN